MPAHTENIEELLNVLAWGRPELTPPPGAEGVGQKSGGALPSDDESIPLELLIQAYDPTQGRLAGLESLSDWEAPEDYDYTTQTGIKPLVRDIWGGTLETIGKFGTSVGRVFRRGLGGQPVRPFSEKHLAQMTPEQLVAAAEYQTELERQIRPVGEMRKYHWVYNTFKGLEDYVQTTAHLQPQKIDRWTQLLNPMRLARAVVRTLPYMAMTVGATFVHPALGFAVTGAIEGEDAIEAAEARGASSRDALLEGAAVGVVSGAIEFLTLRGVLRVGRKLGRAGGRIFGIARNADDVAKLAAVGKAAKRGMVEYAQAMRRLHGAGFAREVLHGGLMEGIEEILQGTAQELGAQLFEDEPIPPGFFGRRIQEFLVAGVAGSIATGVTLTAIRYKHRPPGALYEDFLLTAGRAKGWSRAEIERAIGHKLPPFLRSERNRQQWYNAAKLTVSRAVHLLNSTDPAAGFAQLMQLAAAENVIQNIAEADEAAGARNSPMEQVTRKLLEHGAVRSLVQQGAQKNPNLARALEAADAGEPVADILADETLAAAAYVTDNLLARGKPDLETIKGSPFLTIDGAPLPDLYALANDARRRIKAGLTVDGYRALVEEYVSKFGLTPEARELYTALGGLVPEAPGALGEVAAETEGGVPLVPAGYITDSIWNQLVSLSRSLLEKNRQARTSGQGPIFSAQTLNRARQILEREERSAAQRERLGRLLRLIDRIEERLNRPLDEAEAEIIRGRKEQVVRGLAETLGLDPSNFHDVELPWLRRIAESALTSADYRRLFRQSMAWSEYALIEKARQERAAGEAEAEKAAEGAEEGAAEEKTEEQRQAEETEEMEEPQEPQAEEAEGEKPPVEVAERKKPTEVGAPPPMEEPVAKPPGAGVGQRVSMGEKGLPIVTNKPFDGDIDELRKEYGLTQDAMKRSPERSARKDVPALSAALTWEEHDYRYPEIGALALDDKFVDALRKRLEQLPAKGTGAFLALFQERYQEYLERAKQKGGHEALRDYLLARRMYVDPKTGRFAFAGTGEADEVFKRQMAFALAFSEVAALLKREPGVTNTEFGAFFRKLVFEPLQRLRDEHLGQSKKGARNLTRTERDELLRYLTDNAPAPGLTPDICQKLLQNDGETGTVAAVCVALGIDLSGDISSAHQEAYQLGGLFFAAPHMLTERTSRVDNALTSNIRLRVAVPLCPFYTWFKTIKELDATYKRDLKKENARKIFRAALKKIQKKTATQRPLSKNEDNLLMHYGAFLGELLHVLRTRPEMLTGGKKADEKTGRIRFRHFEKVGRYTLLSYLESKDNTPRRIPIHPELRAKIDAFFELATGNEKPGANDPIVPLNPAELNAIVDYFARNQETYFLHKSPQRTRYTVIPGREIRVTAECLRRAAFTYMRNAARRLVTNKEHFEAASEVLFGHKGKEAGTPGEQKVTKLHYISPEARLDVLVRSGAAEQMATLRVWEWGDPNADIEGPGDYNTCAQVARLLFQEKVSKEDYEKAIRLFEENPHKFLFEEPQPYDPYKSGRRIVRRSKPRKPKGPEGEPGEGAFAAPGREEEVLLGTENVVRAAKAIRDAATGVGKVVGSWEALGGRVTKKLPEPKTLVDEETTSEAEKENVDAADKAERIAEAFRLSERPIGKGDLPKEDTEAIRKMVRKDMKYLFNQIFRPYALPNVKSIAMELRSRNGALIRFGVALAELFKDWEVYSQMLGTGKKALDMIARYESGHEGINEKERRLFARARAVDEVIQKMWDKLGEPMKLNFMENWWPRVWADKISAEEAIRSVMGRNPIATAKMFAKPRIYATIPEAMKAGHTRLAMDPVSCLKLRYNEMARYLLFHNLPKVLKDAGIIYFVRVGQRPRNGRDVKIKHPFFTVTEAPGSKEFLFVEHVDTINAIQRILKRLGIPYEVVRRTNDKQHPGEIKKKKERGWFIRCTDDATARVWAHELGEALERYFGVGRRLFRERSGQTAERAARLRTLREAMGFLFDLKMKNVDWKSEESRLKARRGVTHPRGRLQYAEALGLLMEGYVSAYSVLNDKYADALKEFEFVLEEFEGGKDIRDNLAKDLPDLAEDQRAALRNVPKTLRGRADLTAQIVQRAPRTKPGSPIRQTIGHYYAPPEVALLIENHFGPGLWGSKLGGVRAVYGTLRSVNAMMNMMNLGFSLFHCINTGVDLLGTISGVSLRELADPKLRKGALARFAKNMATLGIPRMIQARRIIKAYKQAAPVLEGVMDPSVTLTEIDRQIADAIQQAGGLIGLHRLDLITSERLFLKTIGQIKDGAESPLRRLVAAVALPHRTLMSFAQWSSGFVMKFWVPTVKVAAFMTMYEHELRRLSAGEISRDQFEENVIDCWDEVDNRMGQLNYDNLFWNRTMRDLLHLMVRSVGWNLGTIRAHGGSIVDLIMTRYRINEKSDLWLSHKMAYTVSLVFLYGLAGAITMFLFGLKPRELKDYFFPRTGRKNPDGSDERISYPFYSKDWVSFLQNPPQTVQNKLSPLFSSLSAIFNNEDYYGRAIASVQIQSEPITYVAEVAKYAAAQFVPFSVRNWMRFREAGAGELVSAARAYAGILSAPAYVTRTRAQKLMYQILREQRPRRALTPKEVRRRRARRMIMDHYKLGRPIDWKEVRKHLSPKEIKRTTKDAKTPSLEANFKRLPGFDKKLDVFMLGSDEERRIWWPLLRDSFRRLDRQHPDYPLYREIFREVKRECLGR